MSPLSQMALNPIGKLTARIRKLIGLKEGLEQRLLDFSASHPWRFSPGDAGEVTVFVGISLSVARGLHSKPFISLFLQMNFNQKHWADWLILEYVW